ncbi:hypothetical protein F5B18DRAFT_654534 [Nemania serpens]|nr:hypothetical protein F5B18DRAFT_654534 [Nemania serpens]
MMTAQPAQSSPFVAPSRNGDAWFFAGHTSSFPNLTEPGADILCEPRPCRNGESVPGCKVFHIPSSDISQAYEVDGESMLSLDEATSKDQVLIFQYKGKIHAVDNAEMSTFSIPVGQADSWLLTPDTDFWLRVEGTPFDIEDFGVVLSAGITCPKHGWSFDLYTGRADRSSYRIRTWEVQLRPVRDSKTEVGSDDSKRDNEESQEVWVRRKRRMG